MQNRNDVQLIDLNLVNENPELSIILHKLLIRQEAGQWLPQFTTDKIYSIDKQDYTLSHDLYKQNLDYSLPRYHVIRQDRDKTEGLYFVRDATGTIYPLASGVCYYQDGKKILTQRPLDRPNNIARKLDIQQKLDLLDPLLDSSDNLKARFKRFPLPHTLEYTELKANFTGDFCDFITEDICLLWADRVNYYEKIQAHCKAFETLTLNPATLAIGSDEGRLLGEFLKVANKNPSTHRICPNMPIPFHGRLWVLEHNLEHRQEENGQESFDVFEEKLFDSGANASLKRVVKVLIFNGDGQLTHSAPPVKRLIYKISTTNKLLDEEFKRSASLSPDYLHVKNNKHTLFCMRELPGMNLHQWIRHSLNMKRADRANELLQLLWKCYEALDTIVANNLRLESYHGDLKPQNIMVNKKNTTLKIKFIDFEPSIITAQFAPKISRLTWTYTPRHDVYSLGRTLALAFGDTHQIWLVYRRDSLDYFHEKPVAHLLFNLFKIFDEYRDDNIFSDEVVQRLKTLFTAIHTLSHSATYPKARDLAEAFKAVYEMHQKDVANRAEQASISICRPL